MSDLPGLVLSFGRFSLVADERRSVDLLHQRVVVAAHPPADGVLSLQAAVVEAVLDHKVHRRSSVEILGHVLEVTQDVRVLERGADMERNSLMNVFLRTVDKLSHANASIFSGLIHASVLLFVL